jgi:hypothetical protein
MTMLDDRVDFYLGNAHQQRAASRCESAGSCEAALKQARLDRGRLPRRSKSRAALALDGEIAHLLEVMARGERDAKAEADRVKRERYEKRLAVAAKLLKSLVAEPAEDGNDDMRELLAIVLPALAGGNSIDWQRVLLAVHKWNGNDGPSELLALAVKVADKQAADHADKGDWSWANRWAADAARLDSCRNGLDYK